MLCLQIKCANIKYRKEAIMIRSTEVKLLKWNYATVGTLNTKSEHKWDRFK